MQTLIITHPFRGVVRNLSDGEARVRKSRVWCASLSGLQDAN